MAWLFEEKNEIREIKPRNGKKFALNEAQNLVGGYVELVYLDDDNILLCDEEGLLKHKEINHKATNKAKRMGWHGDFLVGSVLFLKDKEF